MMKGVVVASYRQRGESHSALNQALISCIVDDRVKCYGEELVIITIGCDKAFGKDVKEYCKAKNVLLIEYVVYFHGNIAMNRDHYSLAYTGRGASVIFAGDEFHLAINPKRKDLLSELVVAVRKSTKPYQLYDESNQVIEQNNWPIEELVLDGKVQ